MSALKKLIALIVCIAMLCICLVSCDQILGNNQGNNQGGDVELQSDNYVESIRIKYATNDDKMKAAIDALGTPETTLTVMGDDLKLVSNATVGNISVSNEYIYIGGTLYHSTTAQITDANVSSFEKAAMDLTQRDQLVSKAGAGASIGISDFLDQQMSKSGNLTIYTCDGITDEARDSLQAIVASKFDGLGANVRLDSASYILEVKDGRNNASTLSCNFVIDMNGESYEITMHLQCEFNYDAEVSITAPDDTDKYTDTSVDEILK